MDWIVGITTILSVELLIRKKWYGWLTGLLNQGVWLTYIIVDDQWGLLPLNMFMVVQNTRGLVTWFRDPPTIGEKEDDEADQVPDKTDPSEGQSA